MLNRIWLITRGSHGHLSGHQAAAGTIRARTKGLGGRRRSHRVLHLAAADSEEIAARARSNGHLREDGRVSQDVERQAGEAGRAPAQGRAKARFRGPAGAFVSRRAGAGSPQVPPGEAAAPTSNFREAAVG